MLRWIHTRVSILLRALKIGESQTTTVFGSSRRFNSLLSFKITIDCNDHSNEYNRMNRIKMKLLEFPFWHFASLDSYKGLTHTRWGFWFYSVKLPVERSCVTIFKKCYLPEYGWRTVQHFIWTIGQNSLVINDAWRKRFRYILALWFGFVFVQSTLYRSLHAVDFKTWRLKGNYV